MTNFAQPVSMECTEQQYNEHLKEGLEKLGYRPQAISHLWNKYKVIATNCGHNNVVSNILPLEQSINSRHFIPEYNPELFLAIAGMTNEKYGIAGEWWMCIKEGSTFSEGKLYKACKSLEKDCAIIDNEGVNNGYEGINFKYFRKATLSELINHFKKEKKDMNVYTLEDLKNGKVACVNDGTYQELKEVLNYCYPECPYIPQGSAKYYQKFASIDNNFSALDSTGLTTQSVKLFHDQLPKKEHSFKFGDKVKAWDFEGSTKYDFIFVSKIECEFPYLLADSESWLESLHMGKGCHLVQRKHCIPFPGPLKITLKEIAEWKGTYNFEIV